MVCAALACFFPLTRTLPGGAFRFQPGRCSEGVQALGSVVRDTLIVAATLSICANSMGPLGSAVRRLLTHRIRARWRSVQGAQLMGLGFAVPYIGMFRGEAAASAR